MSSSSSTIRRELDAIESSVPRRLGNKRRRVVVDDSDSDSESVVANEGSQSQSEEEPEVPALLRNKLREAVEEYMSESGVSETEWNKRIDVVKEAGNFMLRIAEETRETMTAPVECMVCRDTLEEKRTGCILNRCEHVLCTECTFKIIGKDLKRKRKPCCPKCRSVFEQPLPVFFVSSSANFCEYDLKWMIESNKEKIAEINTNLDRQVNLH